MSWLCNASVWNRCVTCQDVFVKPCSGNGSTEHRAAVCHLFCAKLGDIATAIHGKHQQAFWDDAMSRAQDFRSHKMFSEGRNLVEDKQRCGRQSATRTVDNTAWVRKLLRSDRRLTIKMITDEVNMDRETIRLVLSEELGMRKICTKMVSRNLTEQQRDARLSAVFDIQMHYGDAAASLLTWPRTLRLHLFQKVIPAVKWHHFESTEDIQRAVTQAW